ncbi:MAG: transglutaminase domain-containing protein [Bacteroidales bacterium]|nr:transglutaminase domain-containing protein [Bacteroidales bacterium]
MKPFSFFSKLILVFLLAIMTGCEKIQEFRSDYLVFPLGRSFLAGSSVEITVAGQSYDGEYLYDNCGSYWLQVPKEDLEAGDEVVITFTRRKTDLLLLTTQDAPGETWLEPCYYIDSEDEALSEKALALTEGLDSAYEKAKAIQTFVITHLRFTPNYSSSFKVKASQTYEEQFGTCMNFSRLFVAMSRAAGIPSRTVWGNVYNYNDNGLYDFHHQWAEFRDEDGKWHPLDFNYTKNIDLNDICYLDLFCNPEENPVTLDRSTYTLAYGDIKYPHDYPATCTGRFGYALISDSRPDSMVLEYRYVVE